MRSPMLTGLLATTGALAATAAPASATTSPSVALPGARDALAPLVQAVKTPLVRRDVHLARKVAHVRGVHLKHGYTHIVRGFTMDKLARHHRHLTRELRAARRDAARTPSGSVTSPQLQAIAACESGDNPATDTGNGFYGKYQFTLQTWQAVGGSGNPAAAPEAEQDRRAAALMAEAGPGQWPVCGR